MSWIGVDLDGTLAEYHGWDGTYQVGKPIPQMLARVKEWLEQGIEVRIFTARADMSNGREEHVCKNMEVISAWLEENGLPQLEITNEKGWEMIELWDDRAVCVEHNTGRVLGRNN